MTTIITTIAIVIFALLTPAVLYLAGLLLLTLVADAIKAYNIHRYGCWWGELPTWLADFIGHIY